MFVVLSAGMLTALTVTMMSQATPVFADKKKCKDNGDNNCNDKHRTQKIDVKNKCEIENKNKDHSSHNDNENELVCANEAANLNGVEIIGEPDEGHHNPH
jgi:hypothetical protein